MITITVRLDEKRSTTSQFENQTAGVLLEASNLELSSPEEILRKTAELFSLAKQSVEQQLGNGHPPDQPEQSLKGNGNGGPPEQQQRSYGRPDPEPTPKQRTLLHRLAKDRNLGPESIREICERLVGKPIEQCDRRDMSKLIESLINGDKR